MRKKQQQPQQQNNNKPNHTDTEQEKQPADDNSHVSTHPRGVCHFIKIMCWLTRVFVFVVPLIHQHDSCWVDSDPSTHISCSQPTSLYRTFFPPHSFLPRGVLTTTTMRHGLMFLLCSHPPPPSVTVIHLSYSTILYQAMSIVVMTYINGERRGEMRDLFYCSCENVLHVIGDKNDSTLELKSQGRCVLRGAFDMQVMGCLRLGGWVNTSVVVRKEGGVYVCVMG